MGLKQITLISSAHEEHGELNSNELYKILVEISPDIIFEELFFPRTKENTINLYSIENYAINKYIDEYIVTHVSVDYDFRTFINLNDINTMYEKLRNSSEQIYTLNKRKNYSIGKKGFKYLNSEDCTSILDEIKSLEKEILNSLDDEKITNLYNLWENINNKRENEMVNNIFLYSKENDYNNAVFIFGIAHKKSILQNLEDYENKYKLGLNWKLYGFDNFLS